MESIFRSLVEALSQIRSPLMFWGFRLIIIVFAFYLFSKHSEWYLKTINPLIKKLTRNNLFKITRLIIILLFVLFLVTFTLSFLAPILLTYLEKEYDQNVINQVIESKKEIVQSINQENNYKKIITLFESGNLEKSILLIEETFKVNSLDQDKTNGFIVAAYYGNGDYKNAAIQVLERDKSKPKWDQSLKADFAQCIRSYSIKNGILSGIELIKDLQEKYGNKLTSVFWTVIPIEFIRAINEGYYSRQMNMYYLDDNNRKDIEQLISLYPTDKFIDYGYFALQEFDSLLQKCPNSQIKDLALYGLGYEIISKIKFYNKKYKYGEYSSSLIQIDSIQKESQNIEKAKEYFVKYLEISKELPQSDDACYWLGWLFAQERKFDTSMKYLNEAQKCGNEDYSTEAEYFQYLIMNFMSQEKKILYLKNMEASRIEDFQNSRNDYLVNYIEPIEAIQIVLADTSLRQDLIINNIIENQLKDYGNLENCINIYNSYKNHINNQLLQEVYLITNSDSVDKDIIDRVIKVKKNPHCRILCDQILDKLILKTFNNDNIAKLKYLKICISKIEFPNQTETLVNMFLKEHPNQDLADDVLAELVYVQSNVLEDFEKAEKYLKFLQSRYPKGNANDNAMYWLAYGYDRAINDYYFDNDKKKYLRESAKSKYSEIIKKYPMTRFARYATSNLMKIN
jgi:hypothetical protein